MWGATAPLVRVTAAPAGSLFLQIRMQESPDGATTFSVSTYQAGGVGSCLTTSSCNYVALSGHQSLTVNGTRFPTIGDPHAAQYTDSVGVPQLPPGGTYVFVYTDERGQQTRFSLPIGGIAITAPATGTTVPIPAGPRGTPTTGPASGPRTSDQVHQPLTIRYTLPTVSPWPAGAGAPSYARCGNLNWSDPSACAIVQGEVECGDPNGLGPYSCGLFHGTDQQPTGVYTLTDDGTAYGYGFETFQPGPGTVSISLIAQWTSEPPGFAGLRLFLLDLARSDITWSAS
jgi:hypothetical protein